MLLNSLLHGPQLFVKFFIQHFNIQFVDIFIAFLPTIGYGEFSNQFACPKGFHMGPTNYKSDLSADEKTLMAVVRAAESFKRLVSSIFRSHELSFPQYNVLRVLDASTNGQSRITDVSRIMLVPNANMTGIAKRLEKGGFILRKSDPGDERVTILEITPKGKTTLKEIEKERDRCLEMMLDGFAEKDKQDLLTNVTRLIRNSRQIGHSVIAENEAGL